MGIFYRLFTLSEDACHQLDFKLAQSGAPSTALSETSFDVYASSLVEFRTLDDERRRQESEAQSLDDIATYMSLHLPSPTTNPLINGVLEEAVARRRRVAQIVSSFKHSHKGIVTVISTPFSRMND